MTKESREDKNSILQEVVEEYSSWSYEEWTTVDDVIAFVRQIGDRKFMLEIEKIVENPEFVQISVCVGESSLKGMLSPQARSFVVFRDGRVDK